MAVSQGESFVSGLTQAGTPKYVALGPRSDRLRGLKLPGNTSRHFIISSSSVGLGTQEDPSSYEKILYQML